MNDLDEARRAWQAAEFNYAKHPSYVTRQRLELRKKQLEAAKKAADTDSHA